MNSYNFIRANNEYSIYYDEFKLICYYYAHSKLNEVLTF